MNRAANELRSASKHSEQTREPRGLAGNGDGIALENVDGAESIVRAVHSAMAMQRPVATAASSAVVPIRFGGDRLNFRVRATPMRDGDGKLVGAVTLLEDITSLTELDKLKTEFVSVASSRLAEPLNALRLALHALSESYVGDLTDSQQEM